MGRWSNLRTLRGFTTEIINTNEITTKEFVKELRESLHLSQRLFASIIGVSEKTVEKWEQGENPVKGATSRLLYLISKHNDLISDVYLIKGEISNKNLPFMEKTYKNQTYLFQLNVNIDSHDENEPNKSNVQSDFMLKQKQSFMEV